MINGERAQRSSLGGPVRAWLGALARGNHLVRLQPRLGLVFTQLEAEGAMDDLPQEIKGLKGGGIKKTGPLFCSENNGTNTISSRLREVVYVPFIMLTIIKNIIVTT